LDETKSALDAVEDLLTADLERLPPVAAFRARSTVEKPSHA
jgi:hypothetical protein